MLAWVLWFLPLLSKFSLAVLPAKPENISCILYHRKNLTCNWHPEKEAKYTWYNVKRTYSYGKNNDNCTTNNSRSEDHVSCSFHSRITPPDIYTIQVEAQNADGMIKSNTTNWSLETILKTEPPEISSVNPVLDIKRMVQIKWTRPMVPYVLKYRLRFRTVNSTHWMNVDFKEESGEVAMYNLTGLQAFTEYVVALQCVAEKSMFWSDWSQEKMGTTKEEAPHGLDLWRVLGPAQVDGKRLVRLLWKKARGTPVMEKTLGYTIWYFPENNTNLTETKNTTQQQLDVYLEGKAYWVFVISYNSLGKSPVATLRIPAINEKSFRCIEAVETCLTQDQVVVVWQSSTQEVDLWVIEWFPDEDPEPSTFSWESVYMARNWTLQQDKLKPFWCYNISVYPVLQDRVGEPYSIQAYIKEDIPLEGPKAQVENIGIQTVTVTWKEIPKSRRRGFISNYTIFYQAEGGRRFSETVNSSILQYDLESLTRKTSYYVQVMASTVAGGTNSTTINFKTLSMSVLEIFLITSLVGGGLLVLIVLTVAYGLKRPNKLKHLCWPKVPNPAESSIATWHRDDFKNKLNLKEFDDSVNMEEDRILKPCSAPSDLIDKLVVNFENFLEVSTEKPSKGQENILGEENEYVTSPYRPYCPLEKSFEEPLTSTEITPEKSQHLGSEMPGRTCSEAREQLLFSAQSLKPDHFCEQETPNPYLKNSVTTREFLVSRNFQIKPKETGANMA
ncbi:interleukin-31 receptor subunit alpha [Talpa occidentalis]|uniref:interleukin-31 receptor subunit alpha n=1 Tax=Talpa occidentalis TaxID=50954 RepID=UPI00188DD282|nr:interleukin-31 receptor subunit alpha [Talpa occidentalis]